jgi:hypothetical protein
MLDGIGITLENGCAASGDLQKQSAHLTMYTIFLRQNKDRLMENGQNICSQIQGICSHLPSK